MIDYKPLYLTLQAAQAQSWAEILPEGIGQALDLNKHGDLTRWQAAVDKLPDVNPRLRQLDCGAITIGSASDITDNQSAVLENQLKQLRPWRKGPYDLFGISIDTEWRSDWKWDRLKQHITPLTNRMVLDVGCGNGYHCWRMLGAGAKMVIGIDPMLLNVMQFHAIRKLYGETAVFVLPFALEDIPSSLKIFDTVFSMGVLYHRRSPIDHLLALRDCLRPGG